MVSVKIQIYGSKKGDFMKTIKEHKEEMENLIAAEEEAIKQHKANISAAKAKIRKLNKAEKELLAIFGEQEESSNIVEFPTEEANCNSDCELPGQMSVNDMEYVG